MSYVRLNPKAEWKAITNSYGYVNYLIYGRVAIISIYYSGFSFIGEWQDVAQLDGIVPADSAHSYYFCTTLTSMSQGVWLYLTETGKLRCRCNATQQSGLIGTFAVALA